MVYLLRQLLQWHTHSLVPPFEATQNCIYKSVWSETHDFLTWSHYFPSDLLYTSLYTRKVATFPPFRHSRDVSLIDICLCCFLCLEWNSSMYLYCWLLLCYIKSLFNSQWSIFINGIFCFYFSLLYLWNQQLMCCFIFCLIHLCLKFLAFLFF